jgi:LmbE family N-acetylglucosaminyl deacetylase
MTGTFERVLVVAAHSDDETLGCGATLRMHANAGADVGSIHFTDGVGARGASDPEVGASRASAAEAAASILGFRWIASGAFPDNRLDGVDLLDLIRFVERTKSEFDPDLVYVHHGGDLNVDHRLAFQAALTAFRPQPLGRPVEIRSFEVPSATGWSHPSIGAPFRPTVYVDVGATWQAKRAGLEAYSDELRPFPHARSLEAIEAHAVARGTEVGLAKAEAFELVRRTEG